MRNAKIFPAPAPAPAPAPPSVPPKEAWKEPPTIYVPSAVGADTTTYSTRGGRTRRRGVRRRGGMDGPPIVPAYIVRNTEAHIAKLKKENEEWRESMREEVEKKRAEKKARRREGKLRMAMSKKNKNKNGGGRRTRRH